MRPVELEIAGFTAYRDKTTVDFRDADLFALTGPTGSGKSSVVDAIVFALYGSVPRYEDRRAVEPVITLGKNEARIRFDFTVGSDSYSVVRVVRRTKSGGATTTEARLEHDGAPLASGADEVTKKVEELLGLAYEHFTKAVVLPQGEFARFLHDKPRERQELLRELLDLRVYRRIRDLANERKAAADQALAGHQREVDLLAGRAASDEEALARRVEELEGLRDTIAGIRTQIGGLVEKLNDTKQQIARDEQTISVLDIRPPKGLGELVRRVTNADGELREAKQRATQADNALDTHERSIATLPNPATLESQIAKRRALEDLLGRQKQAASKLAKSETLLERCRQEIDKAELARTEAAEKLERLRRTHAAHELAATVMVGEPCPVCGVPITELPSIEPIEDLARAHTDIAARMADLDVARKALTDAEVVSATSKTMVEEIASQIASLDLEGVADVDELTQTLETTRAAHERLAELREAAHRARKAADDAEQRRTELTGERTAALDTFHATRDRVAHLEPPPAAMDDLAAAWTTLTDWASTQAKDVRSRLDALGTTAKQLADDRAGLVEDLEKHLAGLGSDITPEEAVFSARKELEEVQSAKRRTVELAADIAKERERSTVAAALALHLRANRFESWVLEEALVELTVSANQRLDDLSSGAYSLETDKTGFMVVDHRNADQRRSVRTLSGGETFLVSLALALSLSDQLTEMPARGTPKLESIFLDEGFGTLDQETLDVVASVVQQLGSTGLTVGLISHVPDLAEQVPTRFVVTKDVSGAHVERVDA